MRLPELSNRPFFDQGVLTSVGSIFRARSSGSIIGCLFRASVYE
jgi:hypothetical protein